MIERPAPCVEREAAEGLFVDALKQSSAPDAGWTMRVDVRRDKTTLPGSGSSKAILRARGELSDPSGTVVASRDFSVRGESCAPLARAIGVWASLVLDQRDSEVRPAPPKEEAAKPTVAEKRVTSSPPPPDPVTGPVWPTPQRAEGPYPEQALFLRHPSGSRTLELGASTFLMNAGDSGAIAGGSFFMVVELPAGVFLRPRLSYGRNFRPLQSVGEESRGLGTARLDLCGRMPGFYLDRKGLALDICGGGEGGFLNVSGSETREAHTLAYGAFGPGISLRGEFANDFVAEVRAEGLMRIAEGLPVGGRAEMAIVWRAR
ncbi:hypothetical protein LZC95_42585 [Pendulispora brunnea]|uniref:Altered inheritance of mitochondria protein 24, mitochondrial n=1 Tax=Pendulispora brunnea TaxID=2905690 RepID=A0ABZ2K781_9BACT